MESIKAARAREKEVVAPVRFIHLYPLAHIDLGRVDILKFKGIDKVWKESSRK